MAAHEDTLSEKRKRFVEEYVVDFNGAQAAIRAGYATASAKVTACRLLTNANVNRYLDTLLTENRRGLLLGGDKTMEELVCIAFANISDYLNKTTGDGTVFRPFSSLTDQEMIPVAKVVHKDDVITQLVLKDKSRALSMLLRSHGVLSA